MDDWLTVLAARLRACQSTVLVTVFEVRGSAPREPGARMLVGAGCTEQPLTGSIGGGQLEYRAITLARDLLARAGGDHTGSVTGRVRVERITLGASAGQCCGGVVRLGFEVLDTTDLTWVDEALARTRANQAWGRIRLLDGHARLPQLFGEHSVATSLGDMASHLPPPSPSPTANTASTDETRSSPATATLVDTLREKAQTLLDNARVHGSAAALISSPSAPEGRVSALTTPDTITLLDATASPSLEVVVFGAGHVGRALVECLARLPLRVRWVETRDDVFPRDVPVHVECVLTDTPEAELAHVADGAACIVMTHSHALDFELARAILANDQVGFFGLIGSRSKRVRFVARLRAQGLDEASIARMCCPVGVEGVAGKQPEDIAIAIAAQLLQLRSTGIQTGRTSPTTSTTRKKTTMTNTGYAESTAAARMRGNTP